MKPVSLMVKGGLSYDIIHKYMHILQLENLMVIPTSYNEKQDSMTLFRSHGRDACPISLWGLGTRTSTGNLVPPVTFGFAGPKTWPAVSCGLVAILA